MASSLSRPASRFAILLAAVLWPCEARLGGPCNATEEFSNHSKNESLVAEEAAAESGAVAAALGSGLPLAFVQAQGGSTRGSKSWFAEICRATYCGGELPLTDVQHFRSDSGAALVGRSGGMCVVAFRGTFSLGDGVKDVASLQLVPYSGCPGCQVGRGFLDGYNAFAGRIKNALQSMGCHEVAVTGHSLGAAYAPLGIFELSKAGFSLQTSYIFGGPYFANAAFKSAFFAAVQATVYSVVHGQDPVTRVGPVGATQIFSGTTIYEPGNSVATDHLYYSGVYLTPCLAQGVTQIAGDTVNGVIGGIVGGLLR